MPPRGESLGAHPEEIDYIYKEEKIKGSSRANEVTSGPPTSAAGGSESGPGEGQNLPRSNDPGGSLVLGSPTVPPGGGPWGALGHTGRVCPTGVGQMGHTGCISPEPWGEVLALSGTRF